VRPAWLLPLLLIATPAAAAKAPSRFPAVRVFHVNTQQEVRFQLYDADGRPQRSQMKRIEKLLRCHHTGKKHAIHWRLLQMLYRVARHYPAQKVEIVAGYRDPKVARQKGVAKSYHTRGRAVDIRVPGVSNERLRDYLKSFSKVGVGYYPNSHHVHLDVRDDRSAYWVDTSGPGERAAVQPAAQRPVADAATNGDGEHGVEPAATSASEVASTPDHAVTADQPSIATAVAGAASEGEATPPAAETVAAERTRRTPARTHADPVTR
jgi:uncharacterized protein YcbK (DUF882 family)